MQRYGSITVSSRPTTELLQIDATATIEDVHKKAQEIVAKILAGEVGRNITA